jgi:hypoxanthine phosphoribosyltransferase
LARSLSGPRKADLFAVADDLEILFDEQTIQEKVLELADRISRDYAGKKLIAVCILKGAAVFTADLVRSIRPPVTMDFVRAASYGASVGHPADVTVDRDIDSDIKGKHVLLVDGIVDSGRTLAFLIERYWKRHPASLRVAVLLDKAGRRVVPVQIDYRGFTIPDRFVVGYGMDAAERYRSLPYIAAVSAEELNKK